MTKHHLTEEQILAHATHSASAGLSLLVACHLTLCPDCRHRHELAVQVGFALAEEPRGPGADLLAATLAGLDAPLPSPTPRRHDPEGVLPAPLAALLPGTLRWRTVFPGVGELSLPVPFEGPLPPRLFRLRPGMRVPDHHHEGAELSLVLTGGFSDDGGHFVRGDVCARDDQQLHRQRIDPGEPCIVLVVADGALIPRTWLGWLAQQIHPM